MKTLILCTAVSTLGLFGCSHSQQVSRPSANELSYQQHFKHGRGTTLASCAESPQAARSSANELPYQRHFKHGSGTAPGECAPESSNTGE